MTDVKGLFNDRYKFISQSQQSSSRGDFCCNRSKLCTGCFHHAACLLGALVQISSSVPIIRYLSQRPVCFFMGKYDEMLCNTLISFGYAVQQDYEFDIRHLRRFSFRELQIATSNFSPKNILGQGGFGVVYKGYLPNRAVVAVKRMKDPNFTGETQFQTEVEMIGLALHRNLLRLYGFCMTANEKLLVYPYMPNGSVADRLRG